MDVETVGSLAGNMIGYGAIIGLAMGWGYWVVLVTEAGSCKKRLFIFLLKLSSLGCFLSPLAKQVMPPFLIHSF